MLVGFDQYGHRYTINKYPRKELLEQLGYQKAEKMYVDTKDGKSRHVGYIIGDLWINVYKLNDWKEAE